MHADIKTAIQELVHKARTTSDANEALKFSQAANNVANTFCAFVNGSGLPGAHN